MEMRNAINQLNHEIRQNEPYRDERAVEILDEYVETYHTGESDIWGESTGDLQYTMNEARDGSVM